MRFWLGVHMPGWLATCPVPTMVSRRRLHGRRTLPTAAHPWFLDSGGFTELSLNGNWDAVPPTLYASEIVRFIESIGKLAHVSPQDWMCEPWIVAKTGLTVEEHQRRTVANFLDLKALLPADAPLIPVLQGWRIGDYETHLAMYDEAGVDLRTEPLVGLGSVCRRQDTDEIGLIAMLMSDEGLKLHGFGCKAGAIRRYGDMLASADSMAWSFGGRSIRPCPVRGVASCANCLHYALEWRERVLAEVGRSAFQPPLFAMEMA